MRIVVQRVKNASVIIEKEVYSSINQGLLVLLGISNNDSENDIDYMIDKIINLRIFNDEHEKMNNDIASINGELLIISQFTLYGDARKGRRPSYSLAGKGDFANELYDKFIQKIKLKYDERKIKTGIFGTMMQVNLINNGPVTILLDSEKNF